MTNKNITKDEWLQFLEVLHNKVRNSKGIKLTGIPALNEISNFLMLYFIDRNGKIEEEDLPKECSFKYLYETYATDEKYKEDYKEKYFGDRNCYKLWETIYCTRRDNDEKCVLQHLIDNEYFEKYLNSEVSRISAYIDKKDVSETVQDIIKLIYEKFKNININYDFFDAFGSAYEQFKTDAVSNSGKRTGQHFTPIPIKEMIVNELKPKYNEKFYEPCAGSGGFIHTLSSYIIKNDLDKDHQNIFKNNVYANECNPEIIKPLMINMLLHDIPVNNIFERDSLDINNCNEYKNKFNIIATNPPFGMKTELDKDDYWNPIQSGKNIIKESTAQFLVHIYQSLKIGGRAGVVVDRGILNNGSEKMTNWQSKFRKWFLTNNNLYKVIYLPIGIFDYTNFATAVILFNKGEKTKKVEFFMGKFIDEKTKKGLILDKEPIRVLEWDDIVKNNYCLKIEVENKVEMPKLDCCEWIKLGDIIANDNSGEIISKEYFDIGDKILYTCSNNYIYTNYNNFPNKKLTFENDLLLPRNGSQIPFIKIPIINSLYTNVVQRIQLKENYNYKFIFYYCNISIKTFILNHSNSIPSYNMDLWRNRLIPNISLEHQLEIVNFLDEQFKIYDIYKLPEIIKNVPIFNLLILKKYEDFADVLHLIYRRIESDKILEHFERDKKATFKWLIQNVECEDKKLGDLIDIKIGGTPSRKINEYWENGTELWCKCSDLNKNIIYDTEEKITKKGVENSSVKLIKKGSILMSFKLSIGNIGIAGKNMYCNEAITFFKFKNDITNEYIKYFLKYSNLVKYASGQIGMGSLNKDSLSKIDIKIPSLLEQEKIIKEMEKMEIELNNYKEYTNLLQRQIDIMFEVINKMVK